MLRQAAKILPQGKKLTHRHLTYNLSCMCMQRRAEMWLGMNCWHNTWVYKNGNSSQMEAADMDGVLRSCIHYPILKKKKVLNSVGGSSSLCLQETQQDTKSPVSKVLFTPTEAVAWKYTQHSFYSPIFWCIWLIWIQTGHDFTQGLCLHVVADGATAWLRQHKPQKLRSG